MGKKGQKTNKTQGDSLPVSGDVKLKLGEFNSETTCTYSTKKSKKKRKLDPNNAVTDEASEQSYSDKINESITPADDVIKKKKKNKRHKNNDHEPSEEVNNTVNKISEDELHVPTKKKKKSQISGEHITQEIDEAPKTENKKTNQNNKKGKKKGKTGAPVLNDEEAQVTEEDIDKFVDEIDEEDNKQYEEWVKLLDARLGKKSKEE